MRIIDKLQSIDRSMDCRHSCIKKRSAPQQGGVAAVCCLVAPRQPELRNSNWDRLGEDDTATGIGSWQPGSWQLVTGNVQSATCATRNAQPVQHQLQLSLFLNGIIYTAVSQMPSAFSAMFTVVYFVVHRASHMAHFLNFHSHSPSHASHFLQ